MLKPRQAVLTMKEYHPPLGGRSGMRLDFNENTAGCSERVLRKLREIDPELIAKYPERVPAEAAVAKYLGRDSSEVLLTNGVDEGIHLLCQTYVEAGDEVLIVVPTFSMYEIYAMAAGAKVVTVQSGKDFEFPLAKVLASITPRTRLIAVANPNNPTGTVVDASVLLRIANAAPNAAMLVDEAYYEFYGKSLLGADLPSNVFISRTFSKAFGMAGLRCGVLVGSAESMRMIRRVSSPYNVNAAALVCLPEALADAAYVTSYVAQVRQSRSRLEQELASLGIRYWSSNANFVLFYLGEARQAFVESMKKRGILVRDRNSDPGCQGCVRITVGTEPQMDRLLSVLRVSLTESGAISSQAAASKVAQ